MRWELLDRPDFGMVRVTFEAAGEQLLVEAAAMVARDADVTMKTSLAGGMFAAARRKLLGGETLFQNTFGATAPGQTLYVAPAAEGDVECFVLDGSAAIFLQSGAWLASVPSVSLDTRWGGARGFFSGAGLFLLRCAGQGPLFFACYGGLHAVDVGPGDYVVDTSHIVAFTEGLTWSLSSMGGLKSFVFGGEGLVCRFSGRGRLWLSTRNPAALAALVARHRRGG
ncbi:MAG: TIGR00266 family protein [Myxococcota bacterium]|nr:TIGR00266 family protein [Myxococcota bacterium]MDW8363023.1 TIGR00266 family protein [Myxococcales bacterium]